MNRAAQIPWQHPQCRSITCGLAEVAGRLMEETTCEAAARLLHSNSRTFWKIDQFRMDLMFKRMQIPSNVDVSYLSADEVHFKTIWLDGKHGPFAKRWEPQFVTNLVRYHERKVLYNANGRDSKALETALSILSLEQKHSVQKFGLDMHVPFITVANKQCPNAHICIDRFHLVQNLNKAFDQVRRYEFKKARDKQHLFVEGMLSPSRRFILVERHRKRTKTEMKMLTRLTQLNDNIHSAMLLVETFHAILEKKDVQTFRKSLMDWYLLVRESRLSPFKQLANTIIRYRHILKHGYANPKSSSDVATSTAITLTPTIFFYASQLTHCNHKTKRRGRSFGQILSLVFGPLFSVNCPPY